MGTPITGKGVKEATMPGKCAAPPAPAMITLVPFLWAFLEKSNRRPGVLCAETMVRSNSISSSFSMSAAWRMMGRSESDPITMATFLLMVLFYSQDCVLGYKMSPC